MLELGTDTKTPLAHEKQSEKEVQCRHCGNHQQAGQFCRACGRRLEELPATAHLAAGPQVATLPEHSSLAVSKPVGAVATLEAPNTTVAPSRADAPPVFTNNTNVSVNVAGPQIIYQDKAGPGLFMQAFYFVFIGWWVGLAWLGFANFLNITIIGLPLGLMMINRLPMVMTLKPRSAGLALTANADGTYSLTRQNVAQRAFWQRAVYFIFVGIWFSVVWSFTAYFIGLLIVTLPISFWMWNRMPAVTTLARY